MPGDGEGDEAAEGVSEGVATADVSELMEEDGGEFVVVGEMSGEEEDGVKDAGDYGGGGGGVEEADVGDGDVQAIGAGLEKGWVEGFGVRGGGGDEPAGGDPGGRQAKKVDGEGQEPKRDESSEEDGSEGDRAGM